MKDIKELFLNLPEEEYHALPCLSYSKLARYSRGGIESLARLDEPIRQTAGMRFGSLVDCMVTRGMEETNRRYMVTDDTCGGKPYNILQTLLARHGKPWADITDEEKEAAMAENNYNQNWKPSTRIEKINGYADYYETFRLGKEMASEKDWLDAIAIRDVILSDEVMGMLQGEADEMAQQAQLMHPMLLPSGRNPEVKCMFDWLFIDHAHKTIRPADLKTTDAPAYRFIGQFMDMRYYIQASLYTDVLRATLDEEGLFEYKILPFMFVVVNRYDKMPLLFQYDPQEASQVDGLSFSNHNGDRKYRSWRQLADEVLDYQASGVYLPKWIRRDGVNNILDLIQMEREEK